MAQQNFVWIDLEMTGLIVEKDYILEAAVVVTTDQLDIIAEGPSLIIHQSDEILNSMNAWCKEQHGKSGLTQAVRASTLSVQEAEEHILTFLSGKTEKGSVLCGNTIYQDRIFLRRYMPQLHEFFHYRLVDVSTIKELVRRWYPKNEHTEFKKKDDHRALSDIYASIDELKHYRRYFFV